MSALSRFAWLTAATGFVLVIAGGLVTSTDSGLAVPDWPLSYGTLFPPMVGGIRFEHTHRIIGAGVGTLTLILTLWILTAEKRRWVRRLSLLAFGMVVLQGILGGITVLWQLPLAISVSHACLGQTFFATLALLARVLSPRWQNGRIAHPSSQAPDLSRISLLTTVVIYGQLILGAFMRHAGWTPQLLLAHLVGAVAVFTCVARTAGVVLKRYFAEPLFSRPARAMRWLLILQVGLGVATMTSGGSVGVTTAHVAVGALLLAFSTALTVSIFYFLADPVHPVDLTHLPLRACLELTKPRLTFLAVATGLIGFLLGSIHSPELGNLLAVLLGTGLIGAGAGALNQYLEREADSKMERTKKRPLPSGRLAPELALSFGVFTSVLGLLTLTLGANPLAGSLAAITLAVYLFVYTPLKSRTALCTLVGAVPGATPPLIGWAAARGDLSMDAWLLFAILFLWQLPHFLAIAWTFREDYARANFKMLPVLEPKGDSTSRQILLYCLALIPVSLMPVAFGTFGGIYFFGALVAGLTFFSFGLFTARVRSGAAARRLFLASILYLPFLLTTMTLDRMIS